MSFSSIMIYSLPLKQQPVNFGGLLFPPDLKSTGMTPKALNIISSQGMYSRRLRSNIFTQNQYGAINSLKKLEGNYKEAYEIYNNLDAFFSGMLYVVFSLFSPRDFANYYSFGVFRRGFAKI